MIIVRQSNLLVTSESIRNSVCTIIGCMSIPLYLIKEFCLLYCQWQNFMHVEGQNVLSVDVQQCNISNGICAIKPYKFSICKLF